MTYLVERLAELRRHLDHLETLRPRVKSAGDLTSDLSLHNNVLFSLLTLCQLVIDVSGELAAREGIPFEDYTSAIRALARFQEFPPDLLEELARLPGFRNVLLHEYVALDMRRVVEALDRLQPVREFVDIVGRLEGR